VKIEYKDTKKKNEYLQVICRLFRRLTFI